MWAEGKGGTVLLKADGYRMWKRQIPEEKGMVLKRPCQIVDTEGDRTHEASFVCEGQRVTH